MTGRTQQRQMSRAHAQGLADLVEGRRVNGRQTRSHFVVWLHVDVVADSADEAEQAVTASLEYSTLPMAVEVDDVLEVEQGV